MSTALQDWRRHRVDYRVPGILALLAFLAIGSILPRNWLDLPWMSTPSTRQIDTRSIELAEDEGLQIIDVQILAPQLDPAVQSVTPERVELVMEPETSPEELAGEGEFAWDPTHAYRGGQDLLVPPPAGTGLLPEDPRRRLEFMLSIDGVASYTLSDTTHAAQGRANFFALQQQIFAKNAPGWAYEKAVERYRELYNRMLFDNPLRGPQ